MKTPHIKKALNMDALFYFVINILTLGLFYLYFQYKLGNIFKEVLKGEENNALCNRLQRYQSWTMIATVIAIACVVIYLLTFWSIFNIAYSLFSSLAIMNSIFWVYTARQALRTHAISNYGVECYPHSFLLFFWGGTTLTCKINDLEYKVKLKAMEEQMQPIQ